jgi:hypothetical protein
MFGSQPRAEKDLPDVTIKQIGPHPWGSLGSLTPGGVGPPGGAVAAAQLNQGVLSAWGLPEPSIGQGAAMGSPQGSSAGAGATPEGDGTERSPAQVPYRSGDTTGASAAAGPAIPTPWQPAGLVAFQPPPPQGDVPAGSGAQQCGAPCREAAAPAPLGRATQPPPYPAPSSFQAPQGPQVSVLRMYPVR